MRRPLIGIAFCYLAGVLSGAGFGGFHFPIVMALSGAVLLVALVLHCLCQSAGDMSGFIPVRPISRFQSGCAAGLVYFAVFLTGWLTVCLRLQNPSGRALAALMDRPREGVEIIGVIADDPALRKNPAGDRRYWSFVMEIEAVRRTGAFQRARGKVMARAPADALGQPHYGERWRAGGVLIDNLRLADVSGPEAVQHLLPRRFVFQFDGPSPPVLLDGAPRWNLFSACFSLRQKCADLLARGINHRPEAAGIIQALLLGRRYELHEELRAAFMATGTYHIFAISGHHVAVIAIFVVAVLQVYGASRMCWFYYLAPALIVFTIMSGMSASALRGCIMALVCFLGPLFKRKTDIASAMALAALLIVGADPLQLFQAGFIMSFGIVAGLIVFCPPLVAVIEKALESDPFRLEPESRLKRNARGALRWILFIMAASLTAWLVSMPLTARWFNMVSLIALPANLLVIPMATLILLTGCLSLVFGWLLPLAGEAFNFANVFFVALTTGAIKSLAQSPGGHVFVRSPPLWFVFAWLAALVAWRGICAQNNVSCKRMAVRLVAVLALLFLGGALLWRAQSNPWEIHAVNAGNRAVCFLNTDEGAVLINAGDEYQSRYVLKYLRRQGVNRLQRLALVFPGPEDFSGANRLIASLPVKEIILAGAGGGSSAEKALMRTARKQGITVRALKTAPADLLFSSRQVDVYVRENPAAPPGFARDLRRKTRLGTIRAVVHAAAFAEAFPGLMLAASPESRAEISGRMFECIITEGNYGPEQNALAAVSDPAPCRIVCLPFSAACDRRPRSIPETLPVERRFALGPGQGIFFTPGRRKTKIQPVHLYLR